MGRRGQRRGSGLPGLSGDSGAAAVVAADAGRTGADGGAGQPGRLRRRWWRRRGQHGNNWDSYRYVYLHGVGSRQPLGDAGTFDHFYRDSELDNSTNAAWWPFLREGPACFRGLGKQGKD